MLFLPMYLLALPTLNKMYFFQYAMLLHTPLARGGGHIEGKPGEVFSNPSSSHAHLKENGNLCFIEVVWSETEGDLS